MTRDSDKEKVPLDDEQKKPWEKTDSKWNSP